MNGNRLQRNVVITNAQGFHLRPIGAFAQLAARFACEVQVCRDGRSANGKSAWDLMSMLAPPGCELTIVVEGPDGPEALEALVNLVSALGDAEEEPPLSRKG